jgi:hypothetical protein
MRGEPPPEMEFLAALEGGAVEVLVAADPGTPPGTLAALAAAGARSVLLSGPRGKRLLEAALAARGEVLLFLHADTILPAGWRAAVERAVAGGAVAGAFRLGFAGGGRRLAWVAFWANLRTAITHVPYGDQAPFVRRDVYARIGGHAPWPLLEDVDLGQRLKREGRVALLPERVLTSPRRYLERGVLKTVLLNWRTLIRFRKGVSPERLAEEYRR